jgi:hypothetical protein
MVKRGTYAQKYPEYDNFMFLPNYEINNNWYYLESEAV